MKAHRATVRRFIRFVLGIEPSKLCLHQTLTFSPPLFDARTAKVKLKRLLDNLTHRFDMGSFYVMEEQESGALHFHVVFVFFHGNPLPYALSRMTIDFRAEVMQAWENLQTGKLHPQANRTTIVPNLSPDYLLKGVEIVETGGKKPPSTRWWAKWNAKLFDQHRVPVDKKAMEKAFAACLPASPRSKRLRLPPFANRDYGPADMENERLSAMVVVKLLGHPPMTPDEAFDLYKRVMTDQPARKVSDEEYLLFRKGRKRWRIKPCRDDSMVNPS